MTQTAATQPWRSPPPRWVVRIALALRQSLLKLVDLITPPEFKIFERSMGVAFTHALGAVARLNIAESLVAGPKTAELLAKEAGLNADALERLLRSLIHIGIFSIDSNGRFFNNRFSKALTNYPGSMRAGAMYWSQSSTVRSWANIDETLRTGRSASAHILGQSIWSWYDEHPEEKEVFSQFMMNLTQHDAPSVALAFPFAEVNSVCDIGSGHGTLLSELLVRFPHLKGIWTDAHTNLAGAQSLFLERGVIDRVVFSPMSFFETAPPDADVYVLKNILHDWSDQDCHTILGTVRKAMKSGARLLIIERLLEPMETENLAILSDIQMMIGCDNGRERSEMEFRKLLQHHQFVLTKRWWTAFGIDILEARIVITSSATA